VKDDRPVETWGARWARDLERLHARRAPGLPWLDALDPVARRMTERAAQTGDRFQRVEAGAAPRSESKREDARAEEAPVPWDIRARLRRLLGLGADALRAHAGDRADALARAHRADAVTVGSDVFFARGRFQPQAPAGFALLAHEATHVVEGADANASWRRSTAAGVAAEEQRALGRERAALDPRRAWPQAQRSAAPPAAAAGPRGMTAATDRTLEDAAPVSAAPDMGELKRALFRDLLRELRTEFERGG
jgi:Domain of unknown function (DUF4157)